jgi:hypothetical protein
MAVRTRRPKQRSNLEPFQAPLLQKKTVQADPLISGPSRAVAAEARRSLSPIGRKGIPHLSRGGFVVSGSALAVVGLAPEIHEALFPRDRWVPARVADDAVDVGARVGRSASTL